MKITITQRLTRKKERKKEKKANKTYFMLQKFFKNKRYLIN